MPRNWLRGLTLVAISLAVTLITEPSIGSTQLDKDLVGELHKNKMSCFQWREEACQESCQDALQSFSDDIAGDPEIIGQCRTLFAEAAENHPTTSETNTVTIAQQQALDAELKTKFGDCRARRKPGLNCKNACVAAMSSLSRTKTPSLGDPRLVEQCRAEHARMLAEEAASQPTLSSRIASLPNIQAFCQRKLKSAVNINTRVKRHLQFCAMSCSSELVAKAPESRQKTTLHSCETYYSRYRDLLGE